MAIPVFVNLSTKVGGGLSCAVIYMPGHSIRHLHTRTRLLLSERLACETNLQLGLCVGLSLQSKLV